MNFYQRLRLLRQFFLRWWGQETEPARFDLDDEPLIELEAVLHKSLKKLARYHQCSEGELVRHLLDSEADADLELIRRWQNLTFREQQVASLICQGYTNRQIAAQLNISPQTVKVYVRQAFGKLGFHSRKELRTSLCEWVSQGMTPDR